MTALLLQVLNQQADVPALTELEWDNLVRQARSSRLLARLAWLLAPYGEHISPKIWRHFQSEDTLACGVGRSIRWEAARIHEALSPLGVKVIFLKGAAYTLAGLNAGQGRLYQDADILVPKARLTDVEKMLTWHGWYDQKHSAYDQRYYRKWMHELPPKQHRERGTILDVHHNILPETCALCPDVTLLIAAAVPIKGTDYWMLAPVDQVLHSACHLFLGGEFEHGLRDLCDLDSLLRDGATQSEHFWPALCQRAAQLKLEGPLFYALRYSKHWLNTPVPDAVMDSVHHFVPVLGRRIMDMLFNRALQPHHASCAPFGIGLVRWLLYLRSHWLRMPLYLLIPHLFRKLFSGETA